MNLSPIMLFIALVGAHFFFDFAGQGDFMSKAKNRLSPIPGVPWRTVMLAHASIHGAAVALITGLWPLFFVEAGVHYLTDDLKCLNRLTFDQDQIVHIACKGIYVGTVMLLAAL